MEGPCDSAARRYDAAWVKATRHHCSRPCWQLHCTLFLFLFLFLAEPASTYREPANAEAPSKAQVSDMYDYAMKTLASTPLDGKCI